MPQRGETTLEMYAKDDPHAPIEVFEGHSDVVKEFVWRKGDQGLSCYLLHKLADVHLLRRTQTTSN